MLETENLIQSPVAVAKPQKPKKKKKKQKDNIRSFWSASKPEVARVFKAPKQKPQLPLQKKPTPDHDLRKELTKQLISSHWLRKR